jgi:hypothetical protein
LQPERTAAHHNHWLAHLAANSYGWNEADLAVHKLASRFAAANSYAKAKQLNFFEFRQKCLCW